MKTVVLSRGQVLKLATLIALDEGIESVKIEDIDHPDFKKLYKGKYVLHSKGGYHFFKDVPGAHPIFREQVWPWVEVLKENKSKNFFLNVFFIEYT